MTDRTQKSSSPGEILKLHVPVTFSIVLVIAVALLTIMYALWEDARLTIRFFGASVAVAAGVLSAYYIGRGLRITIEQRDQALSDQKISRAFSFMSRWNDPNLAVMRGGVAHIIGRN